MNSFSISTKQKICSSVEEFCINANGHDIRPLKIHPGVFNSYYSLVEAPDFLLMVRQVEHKFYEAGEFKPGSHGFAFLSNEGSIVYNGRKYAKGEKLATQGRELTSILSTNLRMITCFLEEDRLINYFTEEEIEQYNHSIKQINHDTQRVACDDTVPQYLNKLILDLSNKTLNIWNEVMYKDLCEDIYLRMFNFATETNEEECFNIKPKYRLRTLNQALVFIHENDIKAIRVSDVSQHVHTSQRNLQKIFQQYLGVGPKTYITGRRLNNIYNELLLSAHETTSIKDVSEKYGVIHQGNFARDYFNFFNEYPKETLKRDKDKHNHRYRNFTPC